jgi:hypothetical protein
LNMFKHMAPEQKMRMIMDVPKGVWK